MQRKNLQFICEKINPATWLATHAIGWGSSVRWMARDRIAMIECTDQQLLELIEEAKYNWDQVSLRLYNTLNNINNTLYPN